MKPTLQRLLGALGIGSVVGATYVAYFGLFPRYYDISWDEEVMLHDGRIVMVHIVRSFERPGRRLERYPAHPKPVSMTFKFSTSRGAFSHTLKRGTLSFLHEKDGRWYIGYNADPSETSVDFGNQNLYPHVAILAADGSIQKPATWDDVPSDFTTENILPATPDARGISAFNGKHISHAEKMAYWSAHPTGAGWGVIQRITPKLRQKSNQQ